MKEITLPVMIHLNIHLLLPLVQPEPADTDSRPEAQHCHGCGGCGNCRYEEQQEDKFMEEYAQKYKGDHSDSGR